MLTIDAIKYRSEKSLNQIFRILEVKKFTELQKFIE